MLIEQTLDKLNAMKLGAMATAFQKQLQTHEAATLSFDERGGLLVDDEWTAREQRKLQRRLQIAKLRYPATLEAVDFTHARRLNRQQVLTLGTCAWIAERHNLIVLGPTGIGKSFLACAFVERRDLTEVIEDRAERASTLIASQLPVTDWHAVIGDPNQADAICDRLLHNAHRIELKGPSMRRTHDAPPTRTPEAT